MMIGTKGRGPSALAGTKQFLVGRGSIDEPLGMVRQVDKIDEALDGQPLDPLAVIREPLIVHEGMPIFTVLERFKQTPVRLAIILNEYGSLEGIVTQADLLEAIAGALPDVEGEVARRSSGAGTARF